MNKQTLTTKDNHDLVVYQIEPIGEVKADIVIAAAMGTAQSYYAPLAKWLSEQGYKVTTFDYRGNGRVTTPGTEVLRSQHTRLGKNGLLFGA